MAYVVLYGAFWGIGIILFEFLVDIKTNCLLVVSFKIKNNIAITI
jgi:hypothetical protein